MDSPVVQHLEPEQVVKMAQLKEELEQVKPKRERDKELRVSRILQYIRANAGKEMRREELAAAAGYSNVQTVGAVLQELIKARRIHRKTLHTGTIGRHFTFYPGVEPKPEPAPQPTPAEELVKIAVPERPGIPSDLESKIMQYLNAKRPAYADKLETFGVISYCLLDFSQWIKETGELI